MENPLSHSQNKYSIEKKSSLKLKQCKLNNININTNINNINNYNNNKTSHRPLSTRTISKTIYCDEYTKKSSSTLKSKNHDLLKQRTCSSLTIKKKKSTKKNEMNFDFSKFDYQNIEYSINKSLSKPSNFKGQPFLSRMEMDIKNRHTKDKKRKTLLDECKPKTKEENRIKCFNRLISDSNRRNKIKENIQNREEFFSSGITPKKISKKRWDVIYEKRFNKYQEKIDNSLREKIIENEKMIKQKEEDIIEQINLNTKKVNKKDLDKIVNRLYLHSKKKENNKKLDNLVISDKDKANGMKKDDIKKEDTNIINNNDNSNLTRGQKQHNTIKSTKIREKKNSYFGSVIIKTSTFQQGKTNSLIKFIQNIGKSEKNLEKRHTIQSVQKEIKENENENINVSILNKSNKKNNNNTKKKNHVNFENLESISDIWASDTRIKKSKSLKRILVNDFNSHNMKFNINSKNFKDKNKKMDNGINIINEDYYKNIDEDIDNLEFKKNDINLNEFVINDLKNNMNRKNKLNKYRHFNSPINKNKYNINNIYIVDSKSNNSNINKNITKNKNNNNNNKKFIDELTAMKIVEDIFINKIKDK